MAGYFSDRHSGAAQLPEAAEGSNPVSESVPTTRTVDSSFQHHFLPSPFFHLYYRGQMSGDRRDRTRLSRRLFTFKKLPGCQQKKNFYFQNEWPPVF